MIIISSRESFSNPDKLKESGHQFHEVDLSTDATVKIFKEDDVKFFNRFKNKKILLLVHGYNNEQEEVHDAYGVIEKKIKEFLSDEYDLVVGYSWPGGDKGIEWWSSKSRANGVARRFRFLLEKISDVGANIDIMSHSLGARVTLKALKYSQQPELIRNYYCTAPAVDNEVLEKGEEFHDSIKCIRSFFIFHSVKDPVLSLYYRIAEFDRALGLTGPEDKEYIQNKTKNIFVVNCKKRVEKHGGYKKCDHMYKYIAKAHLKTPLRFKTL